MDSEAREVRVITITLSMVDDIGWHGKLVVTDAEGESEERAEVGGCSNPWLAAEVLCRVEVQRDGGMEVNEALSAVAQNMGGEVGNVVGLDGEDPELIQRVAKVMRGEPDSDPSRN